MGGLTKEQIRFLEQFGNRASLEENERLLYSHDVAAIPGLVKPLLGSTVPDAIVQPESEQELCQIMAWANDQGIPVTPRGKATSGYGGAVPIHNGLVIDFYRMNKVISIDKEQLTVTVNAGITFEKLDKELYKQGLTLRLYPSSYPSATIGGWFAQGGAGFGSYEYGYFAENVRSARVVLPNGVVQDFDGEELSLIADTEGVTGAISEITLAIMPLFAIEPMAVSFSTIESLQQVTAEIIAQELPVWSMSFVNPKMIAMRNRVPKKKGHGQDVHENVTIPESFLLTLAVRKDDVLAVSNKLHTIVKEFDGVILDKAIAHHEWNNRFNIMAIKRLGPSLVPTEFIVPLKKLDNVMNQLDSMVQQPMVKEGLIIRHGIQGEPEVVILGFIPADERKLNYNFVFALSLSAIKIAENNGGRAYTTGLYFPGKAQKLFGKDRLKRIKDFKRKYDPKNLCNPGKAIEKNLLATIISVAALFEPFGRFFGNLTSVKIGERLKKARKEIPADVAWYAYSCSQCGYCIDECDQFYGRGWESQSPRGKWYWLRQYMEGATKWNQKMIDSILACTTCGLCDLRCSAELPIEASWMKLRGKLVHEKKKMTFPPFEMMAAALSDQGNIWAGYRKHRNAWFPEDLKEKHGVGIQSKNVYFAGCTASYVEQDIAIASVRLLDKAGVDFTHIGEKENCCATPMLVAGKWDLFVETMKKNIAAVKECGADTVISSCPACDMMWRTVYPEWTKKLGIEFGITAKHYSEVVSEKIKEGTFSFPETDAEPETVAWHDSCHMGRCSGVYDAPRELIQAVPNVNMVELEHNREKAHCCGSVLTLIKNPPVAAKIGKSRLKEVEEAGADKMLALCPCCEFQFRVTADKEKVPVEIEDLAHFTARALGFELPDPNPEVKAQWAVFEAMIKLMTPQGFADLMQTMWPELVNAMPFGMGPMMRVCGKVPGALGLMKPLFPVLFPKLLPMMMPKVMPTMLSRVADMVPMPDYMKEQMPDLMPRVMDNLMPHMIKDVVPLVTDPMIDYLQGSNK